MDINASHSGMMPSVPLKRALPESCNPSPGFISLSPLQRLGNARRGA